VRIAPLIAAIALLAGCNTYKLSKAVPPVNGKLREQYTMRVVEVAPGTGKLYEPGKLLRVHYTGYLRNGSKFDSSRDRNTPFEFEQGKRKVIPLLRRPPRRGKTPPAHPLPTCLRRKKPGTQNPR